MKVITSDRGAIVHWAGLNGFSPALREGGPGFVSGHDASAMRCGWETFFDALESRSLALAYDDADPADHEFVWQHDPRWASRDHGSFSDAVDHARRFVKALFPGAKSVSPDASGPAA